MPLIYTARCVQCGRQHSSSECDLAVQLDDGSLTFLRHPVEILDLSSAGFTWERAYNETRIVRSDNLICRKCGGIYQRRAFAPPVGCLTGLLLMVLGGLLVAVVVAAVFVTTEGWQGWPVLALFTVAAGAIGAVAWLRHRSEACAYRRHLSGRPPLRDVKCCETTTLELLVPINRAGGRHQVFPCPSCGRETLTIACDGIS